VYIDDNVWLGLNSLILKGVTIGKNTVVGANSVVTKSLPANVIAAGNPARVLHVLDTSS
jgi:acetyltransferase-like isoleucine patch superfamily enzyme